MKKNFVFQLILTTVVFFFFLNLFGVSLTSFSSRSPNLGDLDHEWAFTPNGMITVRGTYTIFIQTDDTSFEWVTLYCPEGELFNCVLNECVPEYQACDCYGNIF